jgi:hypothetical protein
VKWSKEIVGNTEYLFEPAQHLMVAYGLLAPKTVLAQDSLQHSLLAVFNPSDTPKQAPSGLLLGVAKPL